MKEVFKYIGVFAVSSLMLTSCSTDDDNTGESIIDYTKVNATASAEQSSYTFSEKGIDSEDPSTFQVPVTVTLDAPAPVDAHIGFRLTEESGGDAADFQAGTIVVPAGETTATGAISIVSNMEEEGDETLVIEAFSKANFNLAPFTVTVNIEEDYINDVLEITADWSGSYTEEGDVAETTIDFCDMDFDLYILDADGADTGIYDAASPNCPESVALSGLDDGTYTLVFQLYANGFADAGLDIETQPVPVTISYNQELFGSGEFIVDEFDTASAEGSEVVLGTVTVENGYLYTVTPAGSEPDGEGAGEGEETGEGDGTEEGGETEA